MVPECFRFIGRWPNDGRMNDVKLMRSRRFAPLFWVQALGAFNDQVFKTGFLVLLTFQLADKLGLNASLHNSIAGALFIIPFAFISPMAGQLADGVDKAKMMRAIKALEIALMIAGAVAFHRQELWLLYSLLFLMGAQSALFAPIKYGILPQYLRPEEMVRGNGIIQAATFLAILLGQIVGAKLVLSEQGVLAISVTVIAVAVAGFIAGLFSPAAPPSGNPPRVDFLLPRALWHVVRDGMREKRAFRAILGIAWFWFVGAVFLTLLPPFAREALGGNEDIFILLLATFSIGVGIGAMLCARVFGTDARISMAAWGAGGIAVFSGLLWLATAVYQAPDADEIGLGGFLGVPAAWGILLSFLGLAASAGLYLTPLNVVLQVSAPENARGRFIACSNAVDALAMAGAAVLAGVLVSGGMSQVAVYALVGGSGIIAALWAMRAE